MKIPELPGLGIGATATLLLLSGLAAPGAHAGCNDDLANFDAQMAGMDNPDPQMMQMFGMVRMQAAQQCAAGNDAQASSMLSSINALLGSGMLNEAAQQQMQADQAAAGKSEAQATPKAAEPYALGTPRNDLKRFYGLYGDPANPNRNFFVAEAKAPQMSETPVPPGYLMIGPMWADVSPWYMKSVSETRFEQQWIHAGGEPVIVEFGTDATGQSVSLSFKTMFHERGRLQRLGDLPEDW